MCPAGRRARNAVDDVFQLPAGRVGPVLAHRLGLSKTWGGSAVYLGKTLLVTVLGSRRLLLFSFQLLSLPLAVPCARAPRALSVRYRKPLDTTRCPRSVSGRDGGCRFARTAWWLV